MSVGTNIISILLSLSMAVICLHAADKQYIIKKDSGLEFIKKGFSVYDITGTILKYRVESKIVRTRNREIEVYPSKQVVGKLNHRWAWNLKADISILDSSSNHWINGNITQVNKITKGRPLIFSIYFHGHLLMMENHFLSQFAKIYDKSENKTLADYTRRPPFNMKQYEYTLTIYSNKFPDAFYILLLTTQNFVKLPLPSGFSDLRRPGDPVANPY